MDDQILPEQPIQATQLDEIQAKKAKFYKTVRLTGVFVVLGVIAVISIIAVTGIIAKNRKTFTVPEPTVPEEQSTPFPTPEEDDETWNLFKSDKFMFSIKYPHNDDFRELETLSGDAAFQISYENTKPLENIGSENISDGYFLKITPLKITNISAYDAANVKRENFIKTCPELANISSVMPMAISSYSAQHFTAKNCNVDYLVAYISYGDYMYELIRGYKGDLGYRQAYETTSGEILWSIRFIEKPGEDEEIPPILTYTDPFKFSFEYPSYLNTSCCDVPKPPINVPSKRLVLAETDNETAMGVFVGFRDGTLSFSDYVEEQKKILIDEYTVIKGGPPSGTQEVITIGGMQATVLKGYSWKGNDLIYAPLISKKNDRVLVISKTAITEGVYQDIINSFKIY